MASTKQKHHRKPVQKPVLSVLQHFKNNWRIPIALIVISIVATMVSAAPQVFSSFQNSFTDILIVSARANVFAKTAITGSPLPDDWKSEMENHWANSAVETAVEEGLIDTNAKTFRPDDTMNRAEMAMIMARVVKDESEWSSYTKDTFCDVSADDWFADAVMTIFDAGFVKGYATSDCSAGVNFKPGATLTRAEALKVILSAYSSTITVDAEEQSPFKDVSLHWASAYLGTAYNLGLVHGYADGKFKPDSTISRAEFIKILVDTIAFVETQQNDISTDATTDDTTGTTDTPVDETTTDTGADANTDSSSSSNSSSGSSSSSTDSSGTNDSGTTNDTSSPPPFNDEIPSI